MEYGFSIQPHATYTFCIPAKPSNPLPMCNESKGNRKSMMRMRRCLNFFWLFSETKWTYSKIDKRNHKYRMAFITLTLSSEQKHEDEYIKIHMLGAFLKWAFREGKSRHYLWKAEVQDNGNIHFHITMNSWIHYAQIRQKWNHIQWKHGYITAEQDPNSTDVHSVRNEGRFIGYMTKYMCKQYETRKERRHSKSIPFAKSAIEQQLAYMSIGEVGLPEFKRQIDGKSWAASRSLLDCSVTYRTDQDENISEIWDGHLKALQPRRTMMNFIERYEHWETIDMNTKLYKPVADKFRDMFLKFHGRSLGLS